MSTMDLDKPLDEIIKSKPRVRRGRGGRPQGATSARARYGGAAPKAAAPAAPVKPVGADATKIIISNLPADVNEAAVRDLMQSTVGPVKSVQMTFTATGKSAGVATVLFKNKGDGNKAHAAYHNRMIDNQRPMKVEIALDISQIQSLASRVAPAPTRGTAPRGRGRGRGGRPRGTRPQKKTAEELDADMAAYKDTNAT